ncbi:hypothetical protein G7Y89_g15833 [Cudoniella acicularis]|uniref:Uncharacterized protein n=1 Tax=Cudoniella acicularis TaxID=354080 RepID=A0A8H4QFU4_9HELO|nr:hypothetical protein G7Y89_g15833 [Cudoniella acicularis]
MKPSKKFKASNPPQASSGKRPLDPESADTESSRKSARVIFVRGAGVHRQLPTGKWFKNRAAATLNAGIETCAVLKKFGGTDFTKSIAEETSKLGTTIEGFCLPDMYSLTLQQLAIASNVSKMLTKWSVDYFEKVEAAGTVLGVFVAQELEVVFDHKIFTLWLEDAARGTGEGLMDEMHDKLQTITGNEEEHSLSQTHIIFIRSIAVQATKNLGRATASQIRTFAHEFGRAVVAPFEGSSLQFIERLMSRFQAKCSLQIAYTIREQPTYNPDDDGSSKAMAQTSTPPRPGSSLPPSASTPGSSQPGQTSSAKTANSNSSESQEYSSQSQSAQPSNPSSTGSTVPFPASTSGSSEPGQAPYAKTANSGCPTESPENSAHSA